MNMNMTRWNRLDNLDNCSHGIFFLNGIFIYLAHLERLVRLRSGQVRHDVVGRGFEGVDAVAPAAGDEHGRLIGRRRRVTHLVDAVRAVGGRRRGRPYRRPRVRERVVRRVRKALRCVGKTKST